MQQDEATQLPVERVGTKHSRKDLFRAELRLIEYPGKLLSVTLYNISWFKFFFQFKIFKTSLIFISVAQYS